VNGEPVSPPVWKKPGVPAASDEIPFEDENYSFREPSEISLKNGWNQVLLKVPQGGKSWKWMFTFVPVDIHEGQARELPGIRFSPVPE